MSSDAVTAKRPRSRRRGVLALEALLVLGFLGMFVYAFQSNVLVRRSGIPEQVAGLELVSKVEGEAAIAQVGRLHGTEIPLEDAYIARYAGSGGQLTAWLGKAPSPAMAAELTRQMVEGISRGNPDFSNLRQITVLGRQIFQVDGPGGKHYFYPHENIVVWLSLDSIQDPDILPTAIETFERSSGWTDAPRGY